MPTMMSQDCSTYQKVVHFLFTMSKQSLMSTILLLTMVNSYIIISNCENELSPSESEMTKLKEIAKLESITAIPGLLADKKHQHHIDYQV